MSKVELTREQAKSLERLREHWSDDEIISKVVKGKIFEQHYNNVFETFASELSIKKIVHVFKYGYEIKEEYKVGDWVIHDNKKIGKVKKINDDVITIDVELGYARNNGELAYVNTLARYFRHATPEEIAEEKERRWWNSNGRDVGELKKGDVIRDTTNGIYTEMVKDTKVKTTPPFYKIVCFVEERKDL